MHKRLSSNIYLYFCFNISLGLFYFHILTLLIADQLSTHQQPPIQYQLIIPYLTSLISKPIQLCNPTKPPPNISHTAMNATKFAPKSTPHQNHITPSIPSTFKLNYNKSSIRTSKTGWGCSNVLKPHSRNSYTSSLSI